MLKRALLYFLLSLCLLPSVAQESILNDTIDRSAEDFIKAYLVIAEPGEVLYSVLGHAFFRMECETFGFDYCFSYESESEVHKVAKFLRGDLKMSMMCVPTEEAIVPYMAERRGVIAYPLNLPPTIKQNLWRVLDEKIAEGTDLPYDFVERGCAISCVHILHEALRSSGYSIKYEPWGKEKNQIRKDAACENQEAYPWERFILLSMCGGKTDLLCGPEETLVQPAKLLKTWQKATVAGKPLVAKEGVVLTPYVERPEITPFITPLKIAFFMLLLALATLGQFFTENKAVKIYAVLITYLMLILQTAFGLFITYLVCFSRLPATEWNWLIIPFNPLVAIAWYWKDKWIFPWAIITTLWAVVMALIPYRVVEPAHYVWVFSWAVVLFGNSTKVEQYIKNKNKHINRKL